MSGSILVSDFLMEYSDELSVDGRFQTPEPFPADLIVITFLKLFLFHRPRHWFTL
jgi:hypothetical protein